MLTMVLETVGLPVEGIALVAGIGVGHQNDLQQRQQHTGAVGSHHGADQGEHADGGELEDHGHDLKADLCEAVHHILGGHPLFPYRDDAKAKEQCDDDDLEHGGVGQGLEGVGGEDVHQGVHQV